MRLPVLSVYNNPEKRYAFVEFRSVDEASNALGLFGAVVRGDAHPRAPPQRLRQRPSLRAWGAPTRIPGLNYAAIGLVPSIRGPRRQRQRRGDDGGGGRRRRGGSGLPPPPPPPPQQQQSSTPGCRGPERITVSGLPSYLTVEQARELLETYGDLAHFTLVTDPTHGRVPRDRLRGLREPRRHRRGRFGAARDADGRLHDLRCQGC